MVALLLLAHPAWPGEPGAVVERVEPVPVIRLGDGRRVALPAVIVPEAQAEAAGRAIGAWVGAGPFELRPGAAAAPDRHGRQRASPTREGEALQAELVERGLALVAPDAVIGEELARRLLALEAEARAGRRGLWNSGDHGPFQADAVPAVEGRFALVEGRVARIARTTMYWYANFGRSLRHDFTFRIPLAAEGAFAANGTDLPALAQRRVRVRGWLFEDNGPMIEITYPLALEVLE